MGCAEHTNEGEVREGEVLQVGQRALAKDNVVCAGPH